MTKHDIIKTIVIVIIAVIVGVVTASFIDNGDELPTTVKMVTSRGANLVDPTRNAGVTTPDTSIVTSGVVSTTSPAQLPLPTVTTPEAPAKAPRTTNAPSTTVVQDDSVGRQPWIETPPEYISPVVTAGIPATTTTTERAYAPACSGVGTPPHCPVPSSTTTTDPSIWLQPNRPANLPYQQCPSYTPENLPEGCK